MELENNGCEADRYRLEATDAERQPIPGVPIAVVDLGGGAERVPARTELVPSEPPRTTTEALTRTVEAIQRTQAEGERSRGERERWQMQAVMEANRNLTLICTSLIERLQPAPQKAQDPLTILKQQAETNRVLDEIVEHRNAGLPLPPSTSTEQKPDLGVIGNILQGLIGPSLNQFVQAGTLKLIGLKPDEIVSQLGGNGAAVQSARPARVKWPQSVRQLLAELDDAEAEAFEARVAAVDEQVRAQVIAELEAIEDIEARVAYVRELLGTAEAPAAPMPNSSSADPEIPAPFKPLFQQLTAEERQAAFRILQRLNVDALKELGAQILSVPLDAQVAKVREMIAVFEQREASAAQRAVFAVMKGKAS
jgi:hypothetical protein